jgi:hypothetical protein
MTNPNKLKNAARHELEYSQDNELGDVVRRRVIEAKNKCPCGAHKVKSFRTPTVWDSYYNGYHWDRCKFVRYQWLHRKD